MTTKDGPSGPIDPARLPNSPPERNAIPATVDQYQLMRRLGSGGTGIVYEARDTALGRRVAIKLVPQVSGGVQSQAAREALLASAVQHPNVVSLHETGTYPGGVYLVMELVEGRSVQSLLEDGPLPWRDATKIMVAACEGLMAVHARGIIHRDIKPANLLRTVDGVVKLADFGLARWLDQSKRSATWKRLAGTPHYMSPEQCREEEYDERTDVYSLGATYYAVLTGCMPYAGATPLRIMFEHCSAPVPDPCKADREIPGECAEIVIRAMAKRRADRYGTAHEMQEALQSVMRERA